MYVFDQTEGKEFPNLTDVQGDVTGYRERLTEYVESQGIKLGYSEIAQPVLFKVAVAPPLVDSSCR